MKILAGSTEAEGNFFLHSGYLSAHPRSYKPLSDFYLTHQPGVLVDVREALALKNGTAFTTPHIQNPNTPAPSESVIDDYMSAITDTPQIYMGLVCAVFFAGIYSLYIAKRNTITQFKRVSAYLFAALCLGSLLAIVAFPNLAQPCIAGDPSKLPPPWKGVKIQEYQNPLAATQVILQGLVANAAAGLGDKAINLTSLQKEVAFPLQEKSYTPGMKYATLCYNRDGWGNEIEYKYEKGTLTLQSSGKDGMANTSDDIKFIIGQDHKEDWESRLISIFISVNDSGKPIIFNHKVRHKLFKTSGTKNAKKLTGNNCFDMFDLDLDKIRGRIKYTPDNPQNAPDVLYPQLKNRLNKRPEGHTPLWIYLYDSKK